MAGDDNIVERVAVEVASILENAFTKRLQAKVDKAAKKVTARIKLVADADGFAKSAKKALAEVARNNPTYKVKLVADTAGLSAEIRAHLAAMDAPEVKVKVVADTSRLADSLRDATRGNREQDVVIRAHADTGSARRAARDLTSAFDSVAGSQIIDFGGRGIRPMNLLYASVAALSPALVAMASSAVQASTSLVALGNAGIGAALGIGGLALAFQSVTEAWSLRKSVLGEAAQQGANASLNATKQAAAELDMRHRLINSAHDQLQAEKDLHDARVEAANDLVDLRQKVADLQNQQKDDTLSVAEEQAKRDTVYRNFFSSALDRARADQDLANAKLKQKNTKIDSGQAQRQLADSVKKGVEGSDKVTRARDRLREARQRRQEALADAKTMAAGLGGTAGKVSSPMARLNELLAQMSPAARELYYWFDKNEDALKELRKGIESAALPSFTQFLREMSEPVQGKSSLQLMAQYAGELGKAATDALADAGKLTKQPWFRESMGTVQANNLESTKLLGDAGLALVRPLAQLLEVSSPLLVKMAQGLKDLAYWFNDVIDEAKSSGSLKQWFEDAWANASRLGRIAKNLLSTLGGIFKGSLPTGDSLLERLEKFTKTMADWSQSPKGQGQITKFFEFFKNLPYGKIRDFFVQATQMFLGIQGVRWAIANPFFTALGVFAASNPGAAAELLKTATDFLNVGLGFVVAHPGAAATVLAMLTAMKLAKSVDIGLKLPAFEAIRDKLGQFTGGGAKTATMTVHAGVVNVYGAAGGGAGTPIIDGPDDGRGGRDRNGRPRRSGMGSLALVGGATLGSYLVGQIETEGMSEFQKGMLGTLQGALTGAMIGGMFGPIGAAAGSVIGGVAGSFLSNQDGVKAAAEREQAAFRKLAEHAALFQRASPEMRKLDAFDIRPRLDAYVQARKESVKARVDQARAAGGEALAERVLNNEREASVHTMEIMLRQYGYSATEAHKVAMETFGSAKALTEMNGSAEKSAVLVKAMGDEVATAGIKIGDVNTELDKFSGKRVATLEVDGQKITFATLQEALSYQRALQTGLSLQAASQAVLRDQEATRRGIYGHAADGGLIPGYSPHSKADNIPTMLTADEFVQPVDAVKHYGVGFMEAIRTKRLPKFAKGGMVGRMPFKVDMSKAMIPSPSALPGGGQIVGDQDVARIAEATARAMGATDKQLIALFEAGIVESGMRNLTKAVDHDSLGFLQQRPSQGWGTPAQITNVAYATRKFVEKAMRVDRGVYSPGQLAQAVQRSSFPERYDQRYADAVALINLLPPYLTGMGGSTLDGSPYTGKIAKGLGKVTNVSAALYSAIVAAHAAHPEAKVTSSYRPGSMTVSGNRSYHSWNPARAADFAPPSMGLFNYFAARYPGARELIYSPAGNAQIKNGRPHFYSGPVRGEHFNHVHLALADGGLVPSRKFDTGGILPPGYTLAFNGTGRNETVRTANQENSLSGPLRLDRRDIALLAAHIAGAASPSVHMDGRKVAEITNSYSYLPAGV